MLIDLAWDPLSPSHSLRNELNKWKCIKGGNWITNKNNKQKAQSDGNAKLLSKKETNRIEMKLIWITCKLKNQFIRSINEANIKFNQKLFSQAREIFSWWLYHSKRLKRRFRWDFKRKRKEMKKTLKTKWKTTPNALAVNDNDDKIESSFSPCNLACFVVVSHWFHSTTAYVLCWNLQIVKIKKNTRFLANGLCASRINHLSWFVDWRYVSVTPSRSSSPSLPFLKPSSRSYELAS